jgi:hypothetical protein
MKLVSAGEQQTQTILFDATLTLNGSAQLVLPRRMSCSSLILQNLGTHAMAVEIGSARATATLTSGVVTGFTITNAGFGFTAPPIIDLLGGGYGGNTAWSPVGLYGYPSPHGGLNSGGVKASVRANLTAGALSSITINNGGNGYQAAPFVWIRNSDLDPSGAPLPIVGSGGFQLAAGTGPLAWNGTTAPTESVSVIGTSGDVLLAKWMS